MDFNYAEVLLPEQVPRRSIVKLIVAQCGVIIALLIFVAILLAGINDNKNKLDELSKTLDKLLSTSDARSK